MYNAQPKILVYVCTGYDGKIEHIAHYGQVFLQPLDLKTFKSTTTLFFSPFMPSLPFIIFHLFSFNVVDHNQPSIVPFQWWYTHHQPHGIPATIVNLFLNRLPIDALKLGFCLDVLRAWVHARLGCPIENVYFLKLQFVFVQ